MGSVKEDPATLGLGFYPEMEIIGKFFFLISLYFFYLILLIFRERKRKRGRETSMCGCHPCAPNWGPSQQLRHVPIGNQTRDPLVHRLALNPLSQTSQG